MDTVIASFTNFNDVFKFTIEGEIMASRHFRNLPDFFICVRLSNRLISSEDFYNVSEECVWTILWFQVETWNILDTTFPLIEMYRQFAWLAKEGDEQPYGIRSFYYMAWVK